MRAIFDGQDYLVYLDKHKDEIGLLLKDKLETILEMAFGGEKLDKKVILEFRDNDGCDGIELKYFPEHEGWDSIKEVRVKINQRAYNHIVERNVFGTRYNGSDKITIMNTGFKDF